MTIPTTDLFDATGENVAHLPAGAHVAGYVTGSGVVPWTASQFAAHPGAVRIAQSPTLVVDESPSPDVLDFENSAATLADIAPWVLFEQANFKAAKRPGQRWPAVYCSRVNIHEVANALIAGGVTSCPLAVADFNFDKAEAISEVANASGPFPIVWRQYSDQGGGGAYDLGIVSVPWLANVSKAAVVPQVPPGQWRDPHAWTWAHASIIGTGLDGLTHQFDYDTASGLWVRSK